MNGAHYHLLVNHVPLFALFFGICALAWALLKNSRDMLWGAVILFVLTGISCWVAKETGEMAADVVKELPTYSKEILKTHDQAADFAVAWSAVLAVVSIITMAVQKWKPKLFRPLQIFLLVLALFTMSVVIRTAYVGGQVNHTELR